MLRNLLLIAALALAAAAFAAGDPKAIWMLAEDSFNRREYNEAVLLYTQYAEGFPMEPNALDAYAKAYDIYGNKRRDDKMRKATYEKAVNLCDAWTAQFAEKDKNRAARALYMKATTFVANEAGLPRATQILEDLIARFPGTPFELQAYRTLANLQRGWYQSQKRFDDAVKAAQAWRNLTGEYEPHFVEAAAYESLNRMDLALATYNAILGAGYKWDGGFCGSALAAAARLQARREAAMCITLAQAVLDKGPQKDLKLMNEARRILGLALVEAPVTRMLSLRVDNIERFRTKAASITGGTKLDFTREIPVSVGMSGVTETLPFAGRLIVLPKVEMATIPAELAAGDPDPKTNKPTYVAAIAGPDSQGKATSLRATFVQKPSEAPAPDGLLVTRKWEKVGEDWGICTLTFRSKAGWTVEVWLPNEKTNPNNINIKPDTIEGNNTYFRWDGRRFDWNQGTELQFPIEVGRATENYHPKIRFSHGLGSPVAKSAAVDLQAVAESNEISARLVSNPVFPFNVDGGGWVEVVMEEVRK